MNLALIPGGKLDAHRGTWTGCSNDSKTPEFHILILNLSEKIDLRKNDKYVALSNLEIYYTPKNISNFNKNN